MIPARIVRVVVPPLEPDAFGGAWATVKALHPSWDCHTISTPDAGDFPISSPVWYRCRTASELADLLRLEELYQRGGFYIDADVELYRPLNPLLGVEAFACYESPVAVCNAVIGSRAGHPAILTALRTQVLATGLGELTHCVEILTACVTGRPDVLLLPPGAFYPYAWDESDRADLDHAHRTPWSFGRHLWAASWRSSL